MPSDVTPEARPSSLQLRVFITPTQIIQGAPNRTFSPTTSTLVFGDTDALLVDAPVIKKHVDAVADAIEGMGKKLTTIFITHGHGDHFLGSGRLIERFPGARVVTTPGIV